MSWQSDIATNRALFKEHADGSGYAAPSRDFIERLLDPVDGEAELLDGLAKSGASEDDLNAAAGGFRLLASLPESLIKCLDGVVEKSSEERERIAADARRWNEGMRKALEKTKADKLEKERLAARTDAERNADLEDAMKSLEIADDRRADKEIDEAAKRLRKADPSLTQAQAVVKAMDADPELYARHQRHQWREQGVLDDSPQRLREIRKELAPVDAAATELRKADSELTEAQSIAQALEEDPSLYGGAS